MRSKEIIMKVIRRIAFSHPKKYKSALPGEIIVNLPESDRVILKTLTSKDLEKISEDDQPVEDFCGDYYQQQDIIKEEKSLKESFDKRFLGK